MDQPIRSRVMLPLPQLSKEEAQLYEEAGDALAEAIVRGPLTKPFMSDDGRHLMVMTQLHFLTGLVLRMLTVMERAAEEAGDG